MIRVCPIHGEFRIQCPVCYATTRPPSVPSKTLLSAPLTVADTITGLEYIADPEQPDHEWGGFHPNARLTAESALHHLRRLLKADNVTDEGRGLPRPSPSDCSMGGPQ